MPARVKRLAGLCLALLALGLAYAALIHRTGWAIPCPFRLLTGWKCPGCGITTACLALLRLDFAAARQANPGLLLIAPLLAALVVQAAVGYVRGVRREGRLQRVLLFAALLYLLLYGIFRNIAGI